MMSLDVSVVWLVEVFPCMFKRTERTEQQLQVAKLIVGFMH